MKKGAIKLPLQKVNQFRQKPTQIDVIIFRAKEGDRMSIKPTDRKARENYRKKLKRIQFDVYPTEQDIRDQIEARVEQGEPIATYIKRLIREDIKKGAKHDLQNQDT